MNDISAGSSLSLPFEVCYLLVHVRLTALGYREAIVASHVPELYLLFAFTPLRFHTIQSRLYFISVTSNLSHLSDIVMNSIH